MPNTFLVPSSTPRQKPGVLTPPVVTRIEALLTLALLLALAFVLHANEATAKLQTNGGSAETPAIEAATPSMQMLSAE